MSIKNWLETCEIPSNDAIMALPSALYFLIKFRPDLVDLSEKTLIKRLEIYFWWDSIGRSEYPDLNWNLRPIDCQFIEGVKSQDLINKYPKFLLYWLRGKEKNSVYFDWDEIAISLESENSGFPRFIRLIVDEREDLKKVFDLQKVTGRIACAQWWERLGKDEYPRLQWDPSRFWRSLTDADDQMVNGSDIPRFIRLIVDEREDLKKVFDLQKVTGRIACAQWWERLGKDEYPRLQWDPSRFWRSLTDADDQMVNGSDIPRFIRLIVDEREDLKKVFDLQKVTGRIACAQWWEQFGKDQYPLMAEISFNPLLSEG
jgi:hypothetical protein